MRLRDLPRALVMVPLWAVAVVVVVCVGGTARFGRWLNDDGMRPHWHP